MTNVWMPFLMLVTICPLRVLQRDRAVRADLAVEGRALGAATAGEGKGGAAAREMTSARGISGRWRLTSSTRTARRADCRRYFRHGLGRSRRRARADVPLRELPRGDRVREPARGGGRGRRTTIPTSRSATATSPFAGGRTPSRRSQISTASWPRARIRSSRGSDRPNGKTMRGMRRRTLAVFALALVWAPSACGATALRRARAAPSSRPTNVWNKRVDTLPVAANSDAIVRAIGVGDRHACGLRLRAPGTAARSGSRSRSSGALRRARTSASRTRTSPTAARTRSRRGVRIEGGPKPTATATRSSSTATPAGSTSSSRCASARRRWRAGSGAIWNLRSNKLARPAGRPPTPPASRSSPASRATTR